MKRALTSLALPAALLTAACQTPPNGPGPGDDADLDAAADRLATELRAELTDRQSTDPALLVTAPINTGRRPGARAFADTLANQLASALQDAGARVVEARLRAGVLRRPGGYALAPDVRRGARNADAGAVVAGSYAVTARSVDINLRILDVDGARVLAAARETLPRSGDVSELLSLDAKRLSGPVVPGFEKRFNDSMCCFGPADLFARDE